MKKYFAIAKTAFKAQIVYRFDVAMTALGTLWKLLFAWILWGAIFQGQESVSGFDFGGMLGYYLVVSFLSSMDQSSGVSFELNERIRGGTFSKFMVLPASPQLQFMAQSLGASFYYALFALLAALLGALLFQIRMGFGAEPAALLCAFCLSALGLVFMVSYHFFVGLLAFKFQEINFFLHLQGNLIALATGAMLPLSLLPKTVLELLNLLPFSQVGYLPAMLLTGRAGLGEGLKGLLVLVLWTAAFLAANRLLYERLRVQYDGVGI
ncbi:MAG: ABC-2 family transporter protein [Christensenellaceae bacterium]|jgi:ABC-2 type transport system permease protein|nr:ABC-2 family transporter protein [Christensenellaceae bacterium]